MNKQADRPSSPERQPSGVVRLATKASSQIPHVTLPSIVTTGAILLGLLGMASAAQQDWAVAGTCILLAAVLDAVDGSIARLTGSDSDFGAQYDSMADLISFGVVPASVVMLWTYEELGKLALFTPFVYVCCAAIRLARFNLSPPPAAHYTGLPSPIAALLLVSFVWYLESGSGYLQLDYPLPLRTFTAALAVACGLLMVCSVPFARLNFLRNPSLSDYRMAFLWLICVAGIFTLIVASPPLAVLGFSAGYVVANLIIALVAQIKAKNLPLEATADTTDESES